MARGTWRTPSTSDSNRIRSAQVSSTARVTARRRRSASSAPSISKYTAQW
nr:MULTISPECIES: hypothetical protein [unclassified Saccharopolyspora]